MKASDMVKNQIYYTFGKRTLKIYERKWKGSTYDLENL